MHTHSLFKVAFHLHLLVRTSGQIGIACQHCSAVKMVLLFLSREAQMAAKKLCTLLQECLDIITPPQTSPMPTKINCYYRPNCKIVKLRKEFLRTRYFSLLLRVSRFPEKSETIIDPHSEKQELHALGQPNSLAALAKIKKLRANHTGLCATTIHTSSTIAFIWTNFWKSQKHLADPLIPHNRQ